MLSLEQLRCLKRQLIYASKKRLDHKLALLDELASELEGDADELAQSKSSVVGKIIAAPDYEAIKTKKASYKQMKAERYSQLYVAFNRMAKLAPKNSGFSVVDLRRNFKTIYPRSKVPNSYYSNFLFARTLDKWIKASEHTTQSDINKKQVTLYYFTPNGRDLMRAKFVKIVKRFPHLKVGLLDKDG